MGFGTRGAITTTRVADTHADDGYLRRTTFKELLGEIDALTSIGEPSDQALEGAIVCLHLCRNERSGEYYLVGGTDGGVVAVWTLQYVFVRTIHQFNDPCQIYAIASAMDNICDATDLCHQIGG